MMSKLFLLALPFATRAWDFDGCTSIIVSSGATVDQSAMASHANDCADCDWRMVYVAAKDHAPGSQRTVYSALWDQYPRLIDPNRSSQYHAAAGIEKSQILGYIPEVEHTYALWEASYSLMNEHGLGMGESTCPSFLVGTGVDAGGDALFTIGNLMTIALERCITARCAVQTMGDLGAQYGFYGEDPGLTGGGEAVTIVDKQGEAWVFHITAGVPAKNGTTSYIGQRGALWAAQRVPDGHVAVVANSFIIQDIDPSDKDNFMMHPGLFDMATEAGLWSGSGPFNFQRVMAPDLATFSYFPGMAPIPMYSTLRMWGVFRHSSPSLNLQPSPNMFDFPFSVPVDKKVSHSDVMNWFRDHYEGTQFDMTLGALAGPWQSPNRMEGGLGQTAVPGQFARSVSIPRTSYTVLLQSGIAHPVAWFAPDAAASSVFVPFFAEVLAHGGNFDVECYGEGSMKKFNFGGKDGKMQPAWWAFDFVANWLEVSYNNMSKQYVYPRVQELQAEVNAEARAAAIEFDAQADRAAAGEALGRAQRATQRKVTSEWWSFAEMLVVRYNDGFFNFGPYKPEGVATIGYPAFWLQMIGFSQESYYPSWVDPVVVPPSNLPAADFALVETRAQKLEKEEKKEHHHHRRRRRNGNNDNQDGAEDQDNQDEDNDHRLEAASQRVAAGVDAATFVFALGAVASGSLAVGYMLGRRAEQRASSMSALGSYVAIA
eukprot:TRINITY_DN37321_c0_g1_i1.p1 TRINITY_DN37321_c0_g1~~TRINITY_DN37321_c0_g1_i1.p1  ORF type:complete len:712 (-),score=142.48 TRINITY_DN37321_c0_g1_i1:54-2189(-)